MSPRGDAAGERRVVRRWGIPRLNCWRRPSGPDCSEDLEVNSTAPPHWFEIDHYELQKRYITKTDGPSLYCFTVSLVQNHSPPLHFVSQLLDISERTQAQQKLND